MNHRHRDFQSQMELRRPPCKNARLMDQVQLKYAQERPKPAIRLSRKDWHFSANRAVLCPVPGDRCASGSCPAGLMAEVGLRWWRQRTPLNRRRSRCPRQNRSARPNHIPTASKTVGRNSKTQTAAHKAAKLKPTTQSAVGQQPRTSSQQPGRAESKQARIIAMLRTPGGATIEAMVHATGWQQHSVRGFLAGVVRKRLGLNLISDAGDSGRVYRIDDHPVDAQTNKAA